MVKEAGERGAGGKEFGNRDELSEDITSHLRGI